MLALAAILLLLALLQPAPRDAATVAVVSTLGAGAVRRYRRREAVADALEDNPVIGGAPRDEIAREVGEMSIEEIIRRRREG